MDNKDIVPYYLPHLRDYQKQAVRQVLTYKRGVVQAATGSGKSSVMASLTLSLVKSGKRVMVVVPSEYLVGQMYNTISKYHDSVTAAGGGRHPALGMDVLVVTAMSAKKYASSYPAVIVDECLPYTQCLLTDRGAIPIGKLYAMWEAGESLPLVASFNETTKRVEYKEITHAWKRDTGKPLIEIKTSKLKTRCTPDHKVLTDGGWKAAKDIVPGDNLIGNTEKDDDHQRISTDKLTGDYQSLIIGSYLGDGGLQQVNPKTPFKYRIAFIHGDKQKDYLFWKAKAFNRTNSIQYIEKNGYGQTPAWTFNTLVMGTSLNFFDVGRKECSQEVVDLIDAKGLAIWFMDDGSANHESRQATLSTNAFDLETNQRFQVKLASMGIEAIISFSDRDRGRYYYLRFRTEGYQALMDIVRPYIPACMAYKVDRIDPASDNNWSFTKESYCLYTVESTKVIPYDKRTKGEGYGLFDLEIKDNHNFITSTGAGGVGAGVVLHNCQHIAASTWQDLLTANEEVEYVYSCSATPFRNDGLDLMIQAVSGKEMFSMTVRKAIEDGWLCKPLIYQVSVSTNLRFEGNAIKAYKTLVQDPKVFGFMRDKVAGGLAQGHKILIIFKTVIAAKAFSKFCKGCDYQVAHGEYKKPLHDFAAGKIDVLLASSQLVSEGVDIPNTSMLIVASNHSSDITSYQAIGRVLRVAEGKEHAIVLDVAVEGFRQFENSARKRLAVYKEITDNVFKLKI